MTRIKTLLSAAVVLGLVGCGPSAKEIAAEKIALERAERALVEEKNRASAAAQKEKYDSCVYAVVDKHNAQWAKYCAEQAAGYSADIAKCVAEAKSSGDYKYELECKSHYANVDATPKCKLMPVLAGPLEQHTQQEKANCLEMAKAGF